VEARAVRLADLVVAVSDADRLELVHRYGADPGSVVVVPNGDDTDRCAPLAPDLKAALRNDLGLGEKPVVVYVATSTTANRAGLGWVQRLACATDRFTFLVVGPVSPPAIDGNLHAAGRVPDVVPYLQAADLAICPIEYGGGTKIKLFESLAAGLPAVVFAESLRGTELRHGEHLLVAGKTARDLLAGLEHLADDADLAGRLGAAGRAFVVERHDWRDAADRLEAALGSLLSPDWHPRRAQATA
jgi:glycosyltransferase involved in cell wall biosynthesis